MANATQSDVLGKFVWYDQMSNDLPGAEKFYSKVVGWTLAPNTMNAQKYTLLKAGREHGRRPHADSRGRRQDGRASGVDGLYRGRRRQGYTPTR